ncbi:UNVERIFIED_CONTAM: hypothetical protein GTU68_039105 [Idotea baltica]|nr:hypothetical protein [Idotea baltica]
MHLLTRFYDPTAGNIFIDDVDLKNLNPRNLRRQFSVVAQDPFLFEGTIEENIAYGARKVSAEDIRVAADIAMVSDFVANMPDGLQSNIGERGKLLSGGQRQRIALARAIVGDPRILILDEATSQIDPEGEQQLHENLKPFLRGRTVLIVTHRHATLDLADRVVVMQSGRVIEDVNATDYLLRTRHLKQGEIKIAG